MQRLREILAGLMHEGLDPGRAAAAVFIGVFIGIVPIYGFQSLAAIGLAVAFRLNKPLTFAATFVNNPFLQPFLVVGSVQLGHLVLRGSLLPLTVASLTHLKLTDQLTLWVAGSLVLGVLAGGVAALATYLFVRFRPRPSPARSFVNGRFRGAPAYDRGFVRWKMRLDNIFGILLEDPGQGPAVDLGCGYGMALGMLAWRDSERRLSGCDLDAHRIAAAQKAFNGLNIELAVADIREYPLGTPGLILILDVLQYLEPAAQQALLAKCCAALLPGGTLLFRVPDRERGLTSRLTFGLDRVIFRRGRVGHAPAVLGAAEYRRPLEEAGLVVRERRLRNRLPLAHIVLTAHKPAAS
jgi:uncharacterized protein (DUF2062 family)/2-polyprenyl-3-methyl-5-hydroxy-6-metoxy-1,4-benzoquinol methylase